MRVNWFRGVLRLWIVLAATWLVGMGTVVFDEAVYAGRYHFDRASLQRDANRLEELEFKARAGSERAARAAAPQTKLPSDPLSSDSIIWEDVPLRVPDLRWLALLLLPPLLGLVALLVTRWVARGFSQQ